MNKIFVAITLLILMGCNRLKTELFYTNKDRYEIAVDDIVEIYYSTNSCCYYCLSNEKELKHVKLMDKKMIDAGPEDCAGCNATAAFIFKAEHIGIDTVELKHVLASMDCDSNDVQSEKYIIEVK